MFGIETEAEIQTGLEEHLCTCSIPTVVFYWNFTM